MDVLRRGWPGTESDPDVRFGTNTGSAISRRGAWGSGPGASFPRTACASRITRRTTEPTSVSTSTNQVYGLELSRNTSKSLVQVTVAPGLADDIINDTGGQSFNAAGRWQLDLGSSMSIVGSGIYRAKSSLEPQQGSAGLAFGFAPLKRLTVWSQGDVKGDSDNGASFVFVNETAYEATRGLWLKFSPQVRTESGLQPQIVRLAFSADLLPRTHVNVGASYYHDKPSGSQALNTWLLQLHLYL